jgi:hypothetical protein
MSRLARHLITTAAVALPLAIALGCNNKVQQCNKLIDKMNGAVKHMEEYEKKKATTPKEAAENATKLAKNLETSKTDITGVTVEDEKLKGFQSDYTKMLDRFIALMHQQEKVTDEKGLETLQKEADGVAADEKKVVDGLNTYCQGK